MYINDSGGHPSKFQPQAEMLHFKIEKKTFNKCATYY